MSSQNLSELQYLGGQDHKHDRIAFVVSRWHQDINQKMRESAEETLKNYGVESFDTYPVPGSFELPLGARFLAETQHYDAIICFGCIVKGETRHNEYIAQAVAEGIMRVSLEFRMPIVFGVLTTDNFVQALERAGGKHGNKGVESAVAALEMIDFMRASAQL
jgi:6,7-dimethyl-8-ribityllumazine synthase